MQFNLEQLIKGTGGQILSQHQTQFAGIGTDTRQNLSGQVFWALKGEVFDGHDFCQKAVAAGAAAIVVDHAVSELQTIQAKVTVVKVQETLLALQKFANFQRRQSASLYIGITGSNGKTTSKEFTAAIIGSVKKTHFSKGSFNNHWGVPFTILAEPEGTEVSVIEMGMNHAGELTELAKIAEPDVVVVSTVGKAHIEHFGDVDKIAMAKAEIYQSTVGKSRKIFNLDNPWTKKMYETYKEAHCITFSETDTSADVFLQIQQMSFADIKIAGHIRGTPVTATVPVFGKQNLTNLMVASACALAVGLTAQQIEMGLPHCHTTWGRNQVVHLECGATVLFDAYNANPDSMRALLSNIPLIPKQGRRIGLFGEMLEMGPQSPELHKELGQLVAQADLDKVFFVGNQHAAFAEGLKSAKFSKEYYSSPQNEAAFCLQFAEQLQKGDVVLVKGSRGMKLEKFVLASRPIDFKEKQ